MSESSEESEPMRGWDESKENSAGAPKKQGKVDATKNLFFSISDDRKRPRENLNRKKYWQWDGWRHETEKKASHGSESTDGREEGTGVCRFTYRELMKATTNFASARILGSGRNGVTYRSPFPRRQREQTGDSMGGKEAVIKLFHPANVEGERKYTRVMECIGRLTHPNVAPLLGWCHHRMKTKLLTVYEFMPNGCLSQYLQSSSRWKTRYTIAKGIASALKYFFDIPMHDRSEIHPNIKPSNVLLDSHYNPMLKDFEITRPAEIDAALPATTNDPYLDPEIMKLGVMSEKPHIYSFGVIAMELACGSGTNFRMGDKSLPLVEWVPAMFRECLHGQEDERSRSFLLKLSDHRFSGEFDENEMLRLLRVGLLCTHPIADERPSMDRVLRLLEFNEDLPPIISEYEHSMDVDSVVVSGVAEDEDNKKKIQATVPDTTLEAGVSGVADDDNTIQATTPDKALVEALVSRLHIDPEVPRTESFLAYMQEIEARLEDLNKQLASKQREREISRDQLEVLQQLIRKLDDDCRSIEEQRNALIRDAILKLFARLSSHIN